MLPLEKKIGGWGEANNKKKKKNETKLPRKLLRKKSPHAPWSKKLFEEDKQISTLRVERKLS